MAEKTRLLVVANRTADSDELFEALVGRARQGEIAVTLIVPQDSHGGLGERMTAGVARMRDAGIDARGMLGDVDPAVRRRSIDTMQRFTELMARRLRPLEGGTRRAPGNSASPSTSRSFQRTASSVTRGRCTSRHRSRRLTTTTCSSRSRRPWPS